MRYYYIVYKTSIWGDLHTYTAKFKNKTEAKSFIFDEFNAVWIEDIYIVKKPKQ